MCRCDTFGVSEPGLRIHVRGTAGMPVGCRARGQAQWKAAGAETRAAPCRVLRGILRGLITAYIHTGSNRPDPVEIFFLARVKWIAPLTLMLCCCCVRED